MRAIPITCAIALALAIQASGQTAPPAGPPADQLPLVKQIRKTVSFIDLVCESGQTLHKVRGTGFFVWYPEQRASESAGFTYLVTNRHVAECWDDETRRPMTVRSIGVRLNLKNGSSTVAPLMTRGNAPWIYPADDSVDLAILPFRPGDTADYKMIPLSDFVTDDVMSAQRITEGSKIMLTGFFYQFPGECRMQPIIREGVLAMMPDEEMVTTTGKPGKVYLGDVHIFGGNSGSPVFVDFGGMHGNMFSLGEDYRMLGVVSGLFYEDTEFRLSVTTTLKGYGSRE